MTSSIPSVTPSSLQHIADGNALSCHDLSGIKQRRSVSLKLNIDSEGLTEVFPVIDVRMSGQTDDNIGIEMYQSAGDNSDLSMAGLYRMCSLSLTSPQEGDAVGVLRLTYVCKCDDESFCESMLLKIDKRSPVSHLCEFQCYDEHICMDVYKEL